MDQNQGLQTSKSQTLSPQKSLFKTNTLVSENEKVTEKTIENEHDGGLKTASGAILQPTKVISKYDCWDGDLSPQEWVRRCKSSDLRIHGKSPIYENYEYKWVDVRVVEYDEEKGKFLI